MTTNLKSTVLIIACFICLNNAFGQTGTALKYADYITVKDLNTYVYALTDSQMAGRETGHPGAYLAENYIVSQFKKAGLQQPFAGSYRQVYFAQYDTVMPSVLKAGKNKLKFGKDFYTAQRLTDPKGLSAKSLVFVGYGLTKHEYEKIDVKDKFVLLLPGYAREHENEFGNIDPVELFRRKIRIAESMGAVAVVMPTSAFGNLSPKPDMNEINNAFSDVRNIELKGIPVLFLSVDALTDIVGKERLLHLLSEALEGNSLDQYSFQSKVKFSLKEVRSKVLKNVSNIIGYIPGKEKLNEFVIIGAHYDHVGTKDGKIYFGADDNASGTAALISIAQAYSEAKAAGDGPKRTVVFIAFSGEEQGLYGSWIYCTSPAFPLDSTSAMINMDMIGRSDTGGDKDEAGHFYILGDRMSRDFSQIINTITQALPVYPDQQYENNDNKMFFYRSDQYPFAIKGIPVLFAFDGMKTDYHLPTDTPDKINYDALQIRAQFIFLLSWEIANREKMLNRAGWKPDVKFPGLIR